MGLGDAKLMAMVGAFLGWPGVLFTLCAGSAQGIFATVLARVTGWKLFPDPPEDLFEDDEEGEGEKAEGEKAEGEKAEGEKAEEAGDDQLHHQQHPRPQPQPHHDKRQHHGDVGREQVVDDSVDAIGYGDDR